MERFLKSRYKIGDKISENPFSIGYMGYFLGSNKPVVIKIYKRGTLNSRIIVRMKQKVKDFSQINHHGVARLIDGDYGWQGFYYVREYIRGKSLAEIMEQNPEIGPEKAVTIVEEACRALEAVHRRGIIHGGLKPANIFIDEQGIVKLADFVIEGEIKEAMPQKIDNFLENGKYLSPEELSGRPASFSSDMYALGLILAEMTTKNKEQISGLPGGIAKLRNRLLERQATEGLPKYLREIIARLLQTDPLLRFQSIAELRQSLENKSVLGKNFAGEELKNIFENTITRFSEAKESREKTKEEPPLPTREENRRNIIIGTAVLASFLSGLLYVLLFGR